MRKVLERVRDAVQRVPGGKQRGIESFAVEGHECFAGRQKLCQRFEQGRLLCGVAHKELLQHELAINEARRADQEGVRTSATCKAGCFGIEKDKGGEVERREAR